VIASSKIFNFSERSIEKERDEAIVNSRTIICSIFLARTVIVSIACYLLSFSSSVKRAIIGQWR